MTGDSTLQVTDERTGRRYVIPIRDGAIHATDLRQIKMTDGDGGLLSYDPAFLNTASCRSAITFLDGERGILRYRGYPIEELGRTAGWLAQWEEGILDREQKITRPRQLYSGAPERHLNLPPASTAAG